MNVRDRDRRVYRLERELKRGGEGAIWTVQKRPELVAKIYHRPESRPEEKIAWMAANPPDDPTAATLNHTSIAWPQTLLYRGGKFTGCLLPYVGEAVPLLQVFNPRLRQRTLPGFDWTYLHRTAANLTSVISAIHAKGYVIGDLNEGNFLVRPDALVSLLDCDSFQVTAEGVEGRTVYRCLVGRPEYTPPELQGVSFDTVDRTTFHDSFGIGVLIFQLLLNGNHPFRSDWRGRGDAPEISVKIQQGLFPYGAGTPKEVAPPDGGPSLDWLHPALQTAMLRCFVDGHPSPRLRPSAEEWEHAIKTAERALIQCNERHVYSNHVTECPYCALAKVRVRVSRSSTTKPPVLYRMRSAAPPPRPSTVATPPPAPTGSPSRPPRSAAIAGLAQKFWLALAWLWPRMKALVSSKVRLAWCAFALFWIVVVLYAVVSDDTTRLTEREITRTAVAREARASATGASKATGTAKAITDQASGTATHTSIASSSDQFDACQLVSREDAEAIIGRPSRAVPSESGTRCTYYIGSESDSKVGVAYLVVLNESALKTYGSGLNATTYFANRRASAEDSEGFEDVTDLGDEAFLARDNLNVRQGDLFLWLSGLPFEEAIAFIRKLLENL